MQGNTPTKKITRRLKTEKVNNRRTFLTQWARTFYYLLLFLTCDNPLPVCVRRLSSFLRPNIIFIIFNYVILSTVITRVYLPTKTQNNTHITHPSSHFLTQNINSLNLHMGRDACGYNKRMKDVRVLSQRRQRDTNSDSCTILLSVKAQINT
jgi:hypothetical protein